MDSLNRVLETKDEDWTIKFESSEQRIKEGLDAMKEGNMLGFAKAMYSRFFSESGDARYETCNQLLGLEKEDLDAQTKKIVDTILKG